MSKLNKIFLIGRVTRDPEARHTASGTAVTKFSIAVNRSYRSQDGKEETDFIDCVSWAKLAELTAKYLFKGKLILVEGRLQIRSYEAKDGSRRKVAEVICENVQFLDRGQGRNSSQGNSDYQGSDNYGGNNYGKANNAPQPDYPPARDNFSDDGYYGGEIPPEDDEETPF